MDCRKTLLPAVWLLTGALGCSSTEKVPVTPVRETAPPPLVQNTAAKHDAKTAKKKA